MMKRTFLSILLLLIATQCSFGEWTTVTKDNGLSGNEVQFLAENDRTIWIGTLSGLTKYENNEFSTFVPGAAWDVLTVGPDKHWVGTRNGILLVDGDKKTSAHKGLTVAPILPYKPDSIWIVGKHPGTEKARVLQNSAGKWTNVTYFDERRIVNLFRSSNGHMWVVSDGNGIYEVDPEKGPEQAVHHLQGLNVTAFFEDSKNRIWVGLWGRGVRVLEDGRWKTHIPNEDSSVFSLVEDANGGIWVATSAHGLWYYDNDEWKNLLRDEGGVNMLAATSDGKVWISTQTRGGLRTWDGKEWTVSLDSFLPIRCLIETQSGEIWAGGILDGLHILKKQ